MLKKTETEQFLQVEVEKLKGELSVLRQKLLVTQEQGSIAIQDAHIKSKIAMTQAAMEGDIARIIRDAELQKVQIENLRNLQQLKHEQILERIRVNGKIVSEITGLMTQSILTPGLQQDIEKALEMLMGNISALTEITPIDIGGSQLPPKVADIVPPVRVRDLDE